MNVELHLNEQQQQALIRMAKAAGLELEDYLHQMVEEQLSNNGASATETLAAGEWQSRLEECIALHPRGGHVDDSRASIYGDRGQ